MRSKQDPRLSQHLAQQYQPSVYMTSAQLIASFWLDHRPSLSLTASFQIDSRLAIDISRNGDNDVMNGTIPVASILTQAEVRKEP